MNNKNKIEQQMGLQKLQRRVISCKKCDRLVKYRQEVAIKRKKAYQDWEYWGKPVPGFGDIDARLLIVGLAPGAHGSNRTGRMFTGDSSGNFLYPALFRAGFVNQKESEHLEDGLSLSDAFISAVCRCVPPSNQPNKEEMLNCKPYLLEEIKLLTQLEGIVALGKIAFDNLLQIYKDQMQYKKKPKFQHGLYLPAGNHYPWVMASYHPSRQNTQTGRLTEVMFDEIWTQARTNLS